MRKRSAPNPTRKNSVALAPSGLNTFFRLTQGKPWAKLSWPFGPQRFTLDTYKGYAGNPGKYLFSVRSQSSSSSVLVRFSGEPSETSAAFFLHSSLFHPGKPASISQPRTRTIGALNTYSPWVSQKNVFSPEAKGAPAGGMPQLRSGDNPHRTVRPFSCRANSVVKINPGKVGCNFSSGILE